MGFEEGKEEKKENVGGFYVVQTGTGTGTGWGCGWGCGWGVCYGDTCDSETVERTEDRIKPSN